MRFPKWIAIVLIISLLLNIKIGLDIVSMKNEISNLRSNINSINSSISNSVSSRIYQIEQGLKKENSLVNEFKYEFIELKDKRADFLLTVKPKVYNKGENLFFLLKTGKEGSELIPAETTDNINFTAKINISVFDAADIDLVIEDGDTKKTEKLENIYPAVDKFAADINANPIGGTMKYLKGDEVLLMNYDYGMHYGSPYAESVALKDVNLNIEVNGKVIDNMPIPKDSKGRYQYYISLKGYKIPCKIGDNIVIYATAKDDKGFNYKCNLEAWTIKNNGDIDPVLGSFEYGKVDIY